MEGIFEAIRSFLTIAGAILVIYTGIREFPFKLRDRKIAADKAAIDLYTGAIDELAERDKAFAELRDLLAQEIKRGDEQEERIKQLQQAGDECIGDIRRLKADLNLAHKQANVFEAKWKLAEREIKILRAILSKNGWLTPEIEAEIAASLEDPQRM